MTGWPVVLADDFTGAAELAGTAVRYGLPALASTFALAVISVPLYSWRANLFNFGE
jgi:hypothetical protein